MIPNDRRYTATHEWVRIEENRATIGITDHAQRQLGDMTFIDLPKVGDVLAEGEPCAVLESVKAASDVYSPLSGTVVAVNDALDDHPEAVNRDPYGDGWLFTLRPDEASASKPLLDAGAYEARIGDES